MADFRTLRDKINEALGDYDYELRTEDDKTHELADTCAKLASENADLKEKVKELSETIEKLTIENVNLRGVVKPEVKPDKKVLHG